MILLTGFDDAMKEIGLLTSKRMAEYARKHGLKFECVRDYSEKTHPSWQKGKLVQERLEYGQVLWLDADTVITNMELPPPHPVSGLHVSRDWGTDSEAPNAFSMGNFIACADTFPIWEELEFHESFWGNKPLWEQSCIRQMWEDSEKLRSLVKIHPRWVFNPVPPDLEGCVSPWREGDWLCHLTALPNEERVERFHQLTA